jgi:hypothetical protein
MIGGNTSTAPRTGSGTIIGATNPLGISGDKDGSGAFA